MTNFVVSVLPAPARVIAVLWRFHAIDARRLQERRSCVVFFSILRPLGPSRETPRRTALARNEDGLVRGFSPCECGAHLAVGLVGDGEAVGRRRLCGFRVRGSQRTRISLRLDGVFIVQARKALEGVHGQQNRADVRVDQTGAGATSQDMENCGLVQKGQPHEIVDRRDVAFVSSLNTVL